MAKDRMIPDGCMTVGEAARKVNVSVRTLQYYDKEGLLPPTALSEGGRRLYTYKDIVMLHQIISLRHLGFSLREIKERLIPLTTPQQVADVLTEQAANLRRQISALSESLASVEALRTEVMEMEEVDFKRYADIIVNLEMHNDMYWLIKYMGSDTLDRVRSVFDKEKGEAFLRRFSDLQSEASRLASAGAAPDSPEGIDFARRYWDLILEFTGGDAKLVQELCEMAQTEEFLAARPEEQKAADDFIQPALGAYFAQDGIEFGEDEKHD